VIGQLMNLLANCLMPTEWHILFAKQIPDAVCQELAADQPVVEIRTRIETR
jgi:hypothetical protein